MKQKNKMETGNSIPVEKPVIEQGQIWEVISEGLWGKYEEFIPCKECGTKHQHNKKKLMPIGEKIEIRFPFAWHYRTVEGHYYQSDPDEILKHCKLIGKIKEDTRWHNRHSLAEILTQNLYDAIAL